MVEFSCLTSLVHLYRLHWKSNKIHQMTSKCLIHSLCHTSCICLDISPRRSYQHEIQQIVGKGLTCCLGHATQCLQRTVAKEIWKNQKGTIPDSTQSMHFWLYKREPLIALNLQQAEVKQQEIGHLHKSPSSQKTSHRWQLSGWLEVSSVDFHLVIDFILDMTTLMGLP